MKLLDRKIVTGIFVGMVLALHYHGLFIAYLPVLMVITLILLLKTVKG